MPEAEGVIKYQLEFIPAAAITENLTELNVWRSILYGLGLIGQDASLYEGYGFGNLSRRSHINDQHFYISASQTGQLPVLQPAHYCCIQNADIAQNSVQASGLLKPSSEALTHAMFYQLDSSVRCVIHVHSSRLWHFGLQHDYPYTAKTIEYGTTGMAHEVRRLYQSSGLAKSRTLVMAGHTDGVICFGDSIDQAGLALVQLWVQSNS